MIQQAGVQSAVDRTHRRVIGPRDTTEQYVWADKGRLLACLCLTKTAQGSWLDVLTRPEQRGELLPHLHYVLTRAAPSAQAPVYCPVPDYAVGLSWLLRTLGFESYTRQVLLVAHTVTRVSSEEAADRPGAGAWRGCLAPHGARRVLQRDLATIAPKPDAPGGSFYEVSYKNMA